MTANLNVFKIYKKDAFYANWTLFSKKLIRCYEESAEKRNKIHVMGTSVPNN